MLYKRLHLPKSGPLSIADTPKNGKKAFISVILSIPILLLSTSTQALAIADSNDGPNRNSIKNKASKNELITSPKDGITAKNTDKAEILVIHSYHSNLSWTQALQAGIDQGFDADITVHHEYLDAKRHPELLHQKEFLEHIKTKYKNTDFSILMVSDDPGLQLVLEHRDEYFSHLPIVFMGINNVSQDLLNKPWLTGVFENHSNIETLLEATRQNHAGSAIVLSDSTSTGRGSLHNIQAGLAEESNPPSLIVIEDLVTSEIEEKLGSYPDHWPIFLAGQLREDTAERALVSFEEEAQVLRSQVPNPTYTNSVMRVGFGAVGGKLLDGQYHAQQAVQLVQQILAGTPTHQIEPVLKAKNQWVFDARELEQANIDIRKVPEESVLINVQPSFYSQYRSLVWGLLTLFSFGTVTIILLTYAISRQKKAERLLKENEKQLENRVEGRTAELRETLEKLQHTQAQLIQTEKMSSLGQLVGGVAHELNNPLNFFSGNIACIKNYFQDVLSLVHLYHQQSEPSMEISNRRETIDLDYIEADVPKVFESIQSGANRIQNIVSSLQAFSRSDESGAKPTDINQSLESTCNILNPQLSQNIEIHKSYEDLPTITCNPGEINQVFLSILANATEALNDEGDHLKQIFISTKVHSEKLVRITIKDTGPGIPQQIQDKVFDPFFTTKPIGSGTGLGLSLAYQTIKKHQGNIALRSDGKSGTEFIIDLPTA